MTDSFVVERTLDWTCTCIALGHDHEPFECDRQAKVLGGRCNDCTYWEFEHREKEN
jgi:hypothetical protein